MFWLIALKLVTKLITLCKKALISKSKNPNYRIRVQILRTFFNFMDTPGTCENHKTIILFPISEARKKRTWRLVFLFEVIDPGHKGTQRGTKGLQILNISWLLFLKLGRKFIQERIKFYLGDPGEKKVTLFGWMTHRTYALFLEEVFFQFFLCHICLSVHFFIRTSI